MTTHSCPRCGAPVYGSIDLCYQCALRRIAQDFERYINIDAPTPIEFRIRPLRCDECGHELNEKKQCDNVECSAFWFYGLG